MSRRNHYIVMRHGHSEANARELIVSDPGHGCTAFGLSDRGRREVSWRASDCPLIAAATRILCSDFLRARETADIVRAHHPALPLTTDRRLRERYFGDFDMQSNRHYEEVWAQDRRDPGCAIAGVEPATAVMARMLAVIDACEARYRGESLLLVSHGDPLQILECGLTGLDPSRHRDLPMLETAVTRSLDGGPDGRAAGPTTRDAPTRRGES